MVTYPTSPTCDTNFDFAGAFLLLNVMPAQARARTPAESTAVTVYEKEPLRMKPVPEDIEDILAIFF